MSRTENESRTLWKQARNVLRVLSVHILNLTERHWNIRINAAFMKVIKMPHK